MRLALRFPCALLFVIGCAEAECLDAACRDGFHPFRGAPSAGVAPIAPPRDSMLPPDEPCAETEFGRGPGEPESCDAADNDCDGAVDEGCGCEPEATQICYSGSSATRNIGLCAEGYQQCGASGAWGLCLGEQTPVGEVCDALDNDCDAYVDEGACGSDGPGPMPPARETCDDGADNDSDGFADCEDRDCACCVPSWETFPVAAEPADVLFVIDRSGSMLEDIGGLTRWDAAVEAMGDVLPEIDDVLYLGAYFYPADVDNVWTSGCGVPSAPYVDIGRNRGAAITAALASRDPGGSTPTMFALDSVRLYLAARPATRPRYLVIVSDGQPGCFPGTPDNTIARIEDLRVEDGLESFVIGIAPDSDPALQDVLNRMALAGGRPRPGTTKFYSSRTAAELAHAIRGVAAAMSECRYELAETPERPDEVHVSFDDMAVVRDTSDGWAFDGGGHEAILFRGTACAMLTSGTVEQIRVERGC